MTEYEELKHALKNGSLVYINMLRGVIAIPRFIEFVSLYGEVFNDLDAANLEIAKLRNRIKELEDETRRPT